MNTKEQKQIANAGNRLLVNQNAGGQLWVVGKGMERLNTIQEPFLILDDIPVFHMYYNYPEFDWPEYDRAKIHKWGQTYWWDLVLSGREMGGNVKFYVDTRVGGWYLMWQGLKMDVGDWGPNDFDYFPIAWTPKLKNDNLTIAGFRMFWAWVLKTAYEEESIYTDYFYIYNDYSSVNCVLGAAAIGETEYKSEAEFQRYMDRAPDMLKPHIERNKIINPKRYNRWGGKM